MVEATSADHGLRGTLFPATIIARLCRSNKFVVEYKYLQANDEPLREKVDTALLRPLPPPGHDYGFDFGDEVDAFFSGGWWEGVITEAVEGSTYWVYFRFAQQQFPFQPSELRHHREWVNGTWLPPRVSVLFFNISLLGSLVSLYVVFSLNRNRFLFSIRKVEEGENHRIFTKFWKSE